MIGFVLATFLYWVVIDYTITNIIIILTYNGLDILTEIL